MNDDLQPAAASSWAGAACLEGLLAQAVPDDALPHIDPAVLDRFLTPITTRESLLDRKFIETAHTFDFRFRGRKVAAYEWGSSAAPTVLAMHGWGGRAAQFQCMVPRLVERGLRVLAFDAPAHGRSEGSRTSLFDFADALATFVGLQHGRIDAVLGHSMGAASATMALWRRAGPVKRMVLIAPICRLEDVVRRFAMRMKLTPQQEAALKQVLAGMFGSDIWQVSSLAHIGTRMKAQALILHDREDAEIPYQDGVDTAQAWPGSQFVSTAGLGHRTILRDEAVIERVQSFLCKGLLRDYVN